MTAPSRSSRSRNPGRACGSTKAIEVERPDVLVGGLAGEAEHQPEMRIGGDGLTAVGGDAADVDAFVDRLEQAGEGACDGFVARFRAPSRIASLMA